MIESGKIVITFDYDSKRQMISVSEKDSHDMSVAEFFQCYFTNKKIGVVESDFNYSTFLNLLKKACELDFDVGEMASFASDNGVNVVRFLFHRKKENIVGCNVYLIELLSTPEEQLSRDYLTGVLNRGSLIQECESAMRNMVGDDYLIVVDLDNFKLANDTLGHIAGDTYLKNIANMINEICKREIVGRYGGDEFVIYLRNISKVKLNDIVEKILDIKLDYSEKGHTAQIMVTCSIGITKIETGEKKMANAFERADHALYKAKHMGKNAACFSSGEYFNRRVINTDVKNKKTKYEAIKTKKKNSRLFRKELKNKKIYNTVFASIAITLLITISLLVSNFYSTIFEKNTRNEAHTVMQDISSQIENNIFNNINNWLGQFRITESIIANIDATLENAEALLNQAIDILEEQIEGSRISVLLEAGDLYYTNGNEYNISSSELADFVIAQKRDYIGTYYVNYVGEMITFAVPYTSSSRSVFSDGNKNIAGIVGMISIENFSKILKSTAFNNTPYFTLTKHDGTIICNSASSEEDKEIFASSNNIFNIWSNYSGKESTNKLIDNFSNNMADVSNIKIDDTEYISFYSPVAIGDWYLFITVPSNVVLSDVVAAFSSTELVVNILLIFISMIILVLTILFNKLRTKNQVITYIDPVTNDINFERFKIDAEKILAQASKNSYSMVYLNIKHFKFLSENLGSKKSDEILKQTFDIIDNQLSPQELVAHVISDRFAILLNEFDEDIIKRRLSSLADKIKKTINANDIFDVLVTQGVYKITDSKATISVDTDRAHMAQLVIKDFYSNDGINFFDETWEENDAMTFDIEHKQEIALKEKQFQVYYQMKKDIKNDNWYGSEALVRWIDPVHGMISPGVFIPLFEKNGFVIKIDLYVFEKVCQDIQEFTSLGCTPLRVSVNVSRSHLLHNNFLNKYFEIIRKYNVDPGLIEFELTESMAYESKDILIRVIQDIHNFGCTCSIDDFGSGYSSLNMLKEFAFDVIKLDQAFFKGSNGFDEKAQIIVASIIDLCHGLNKQVVAEGVEDIKQVEFLKKHNCDAIQGFYYSKPSPFTEYKYKLEGDKN